MSDILFEWKLIIRNKRLTQSFILLLIFIPFMYLSPNKAELFGCFLIRMCFWITLMSVIASYIGTFLFSTDASFIEKILTLPNALFRSIVSKYHLCLIISVSIALILLPISFVTKEIIVFEIIAALFFSIGFIFFALFYFSLISYKPFDVKASNFANHQGFNAIIYFGQILTLGCSIGFIILLHQLLGETVTLIIISIIGILFLGTHKFWLRGICRGFEKTKHKRLERFREK